MLKHNQEHPDAGHERGGRAAHLALRNRSVTTGTPPNLEMTMLSCTRFGDHQADLIG